MGKETWEGIIEEIKFNIDKLLDKKERIIVALEGKSGSGKSSLAKSLGDLYDLNIFHMDDFFLAKNLRTEERLEEIGGNVDYVRFKEEVIDKILEGSIFHYRVFDCKAMDFTDRVEVRSRRINLVEGCYSLHPSLIDNYDLKVFLDIDEDIQKNRILKRNGPQMLERFLDEWIPKENKYFDEMQIREKSDLYFKGSVIL